MIPNISNKLIEIQVIITCKEYEDGHIRGTSVVIITDAS